MFEVGDLVKVVKAQADIDEMKQMIGHVCRIKEAHDSYYVLEELPIFTWLPEWLEPCNTLYYVGDEVIVCDKLDEMWLVGEPFIAQEMYKWQGKTVTIHSITTSDNIYVYQFKEDATKFYFAERWLSPAISFNIEKDDILSVLSR